MVQKVAVVRKTLDFNAVNDVENFSVTDFGTVAAAIVIVCNSNATSQDQSGVVQSIGFWDGTNQCCASVSAGDNVSAPSVQHTTRFRSDAYIAGAAATASATTQVIFAYEAAPITNGISLTLKVDNTGAGRYCTVILIGGISAKVFTHTPSTTDGSTQTYPSSLGFAPKALLALSIATAGNTPADTNTQTRAAAISFGMTRQSDSAARMLTWYIANTGSGGVSVATQLFSEGYFVGQAVTALDWACTVTTWGTTDFTTTTTGTTGSDDFVGLALGGDVSFDMGTLTTSDSETVNQDVTTTINPEAVLLTLGTTSNAGTIVTDSLANGWTNGIASASAQYSHNSYYADNVSTSNAGSYSTATTFVDLDSTDATTRSDIQTGTVTLGTEKFTIDYSLASATARKGWWVAFGPVNATVPTLSASTYVPGSLTSTGWRPQITAS